MYKQTLSTWQVYFQNYLKYRHQLRAKGEITLLALIIDGTQTTALM